MTLGPIICGHVTRRLVGTVFGILLLAAGLWRAHVGPRWIAPTLVAFVVIEFAGAGLTQWASSYIATLLYVIALFALARTVVTMSDQEWAGA